MKVLITGGGGFLGFHLHRKLETLGHDVISIDNFSHTCKAPFKVKYGDVRYFHDIEPLVEWADLVYHLAAQIHVDKSISNPQETIDTNVFGTLNVLESCRKYKKKLIFASSSEVYGTSQSRTMDETHPLDVQSPYAASKVAGDRLCHSYNETYGMNVAILRNFNTFGEWQNDGSYGGVIAIFTRKALRGEPLTIFGDGTQERDYMYIDDALQGYELVSNYVGALNIGTGKTVTINKLSEMIKNITKSNSDIIHVAPRAGEVQRLCAGTMEAQAIGFVPKTDLERDLNKYIKWYCNEN